MTMAGSPEPQWSGPLCSSCSPRSRRGGSTSFVVYKVDRLTRSIADFAKIVEILETKGASFVSVTQQFNTTTSMGGLTLNLLLSFAQFERESPASAFATRSPPRKRRACGWAACRRSATRLATRELVVVDREAKTVRHIFRRYADSARSDH